MIYFIPKEEWIFEKGDRLKVFAKKYNPDLNDFQEELIEEFVLDDFYYDESIECYLVMSELNLGKAQLKEKLQDAEIFIRKEE
jgi:hypothetical protein